MKEPSPKENCARGKSTEVLANKPTSAFRPVTL